MLPKLPDFNSLKRIAQLDPEALERIRQQHVEAIIASSPKHLRQRLRGLQFQIDMQRRLNPNPLSACIKISQMMHESFDQLRFLLNHTTGNKQSHHLYEDVSDKQPTSATILEFQRPEAATQ